MDFNFHLELFGKNFDIFGLYEHITTELNLEYSSLLESVEEDTRETLYSFICLQPDFVFEIKNGKSNIRNVFSERGEKILEEINSRELRQDQTGDKVLDDHVRYDMKSFDELERYIIFDKNSFREIFPRNVFYGGMLGYIAYDTVASWVKFESKSTYPDVIMGMHSKVLIYNHKTKQLFGIENTLDDETYYASPRELRRLIRNYNPKPPRKFPNVPLKVLDEFESTVPFEKYSEMIEKTREYIYAGDIIQAVISRKIFYETKADDLDIYSALRQLNPSPYMYYLNFKDIRIIGSSPEALVSIDNEIIRTVPIAGTRKRGQTEEEDKAMSEELLNDPKEKAEHVMLVDLARNDLAKVSKAGTVKALDYQILRKFKHLMHMVTHLESERREVSSVEILRSMFPAGTVSGAPKLRAMEIIQEIEQESRGPYAGACGYINMNGDLEFAIAIRTIFLNKEQLTIQAGGGIVKDSQPRLEWIETRNKMRSILRAIKMAEGLHE